MVNRVPCKVLKVHENAKLPEPSETNKNTYNLYATSESSKVDGAGYRLTYKTGLVLDLDSNYTAYILPLPDIAINTTLILGNSLTQVDRNEIQLEFRNLSTHGLKKYKVGDKVGQLIVVPKFEVVFNEQDQE